MNNELGQAKMSKLIWKICIPMIFSMMLLAAYTVVDASFVINMGKEGVNANLAITYAFPVQMFSGALGVGTGIGINALLSKSLGEKNSKKVSKIVGNGLFLAFCIWILFLIFGLFFSEAFIKMQAGNNQEVIKMGTDYLKITCCLSFGQIGYTVSERFLQSNGKTTLSMIAQISGSVINIVLDYIFIYPLKLGVAGAAWATVIGQIASFIIAMTFHLVTNKSMRPHLKDFLPSGDIFKQIYSVGWSAAIMQALVSLSLLGSVLILGQGQSNSELLQGSFGIYFKISQFALFACFGMSNGIITIMSYNYGEKNKERCKECAKYGIIMTLIVTGILTLIFEIFGDPITKQFFLTGNNDVEKVGKVVVVGLRIGAASFMFMGITVSIQGMLQAFRFPVSPLILSFLRLVGIVFPFLYLFSLTSNPENTIWFAIPIAEVITAIVAVILCIHAFKKALGTIEQN